MKSLYVALARLARMLLRAVGVLGWLENRGARSRRAVWLRSLLSIFDVEDLARLDVPWWTFESADRVDRFLAATHEAKVFEWGSGASTLWLAGRSHSVLTVEHDEDWAHSLMKMLPETVDLVMAPAETLTGPGGVASAKPGHEGLDFSNYVAVIDRNDDQYDLIVIDGRAREACLARTLDHLAPGGLIVFDNVDRARYRAAIAAVFPFDVVWTQGLTPALPYPTRTALLSRPT